MYLKSVPNHFKVFTTKSFEVNPSNINPKYILRASIGCHLSFKWPLSCHIEFQAGIIIGTKLKYKNTDVIMQGSVKQQ